jgi:hypothetical protein
VSLRRLDDFSSTTLLYTSFIDDFKDLTMVYTSLADLSDAQKEELVASLSCLIVGDELTAETLSAVATASGNSLSDALAAVFVSVVSKAPKGIEQFSPPPGGGGGGG